MARILHKECRTALNRCAIPGMDYCLNPYTGCGHGCVYCYACFMKRFCGIDDHWGSFVQVKLNFAEQLKKQLQHPKQGKVMLSSVTDPYQPVERQYKLTHHCLKLLADSEMSVSILTKSDLILRDLDLLLRIPRIEVGFTITAADNVTAWLLEPGASPPERRFQALARLSEAGIPTWVFIAPVVPCVGDTEANLTAILKKSKDAGARKVEYDALNFYPVAVSNLKQLFRRHWPQFAGEFNTICQDTDRYRRYLFDLAQSLWPVYGF